MSGKLHAFTMPKWGIEMTEGTLAEWVMPEGKRFRKGEVLALIETDKIANEVESHLDGVIARYCAEAGDVLPVGALLAVIADGDVAAEDVEQFAANFKGAGPVSAVASERTAAQPEKKSAKPEALAPAPRQAKAETAPPPAPAADDKSAAADEDLSIDASPEARRRAQELGVSLTTVTSSGRGGRITRQDVEMAAAGSATTSAATQPIVSEANISPAARALAQLLDVDLEDVEGSGRGGRITRQDVEQAAIRAGKSLDDIAAADEAVRASPLARRLAQSIGLSLNDVSGSGPRGRITRQDVETAGRQSAPLGDNAYRTEKMSGMRRAIAQRLEEAKRTIPHFYLTIDVELDDLLVLRAQANSRKGAEKLSVNDFVIRAAGLAMREVPDCNVQYVDGERRLFERADIAVAVAVPGGLITPVVRGADVRSVDQIAADMKDLAARARAGKLMPEDYRGGAFSISNLGMYGIKHFDAVINPPQGAILAVGAGEKRLVVKDDDAAVATVMTVTMSCDHRVIDGALGAEWLAAFKDLMESPIRLVL